MSEPQAITLAARPGPNAAARRIAEMLRVDHAGEYGAVQIYRGQRAIFDRAPGKTRIAGQLAEMEREEQTHLDTFDALLLRRGVRPTVFAPVWSAAGFALGAVTALMGEKAAHAATVAVEEVIADHYADQVAELGGSEPELAATFAAFREDEIGHKTLAEEEGAREAPGYAFLSGAIRLGCRIAIRVSEKL
jgi:3-demethoxyubiquinol 3-hydroxylase